MHFWQCRRQCRLVTSLFGNKIQYSKCVVRSSAFSGYLLTSLLAWARIYTIYNVSAIDCDHLDDKIGGDNPGLKNIVAAARTNDGRALEWKIGQEGVVGANCFCRKTRRIPNDIVYNYRIYDKSGHIMIALCCKQQALHLTKLSGYAKWMYWDVIDRLIVFKFCGKIGCFTVLHYLLTTSLHRDSWAYSNQILIVTIWSLHDIHTAIRRRHHSWSFLFLCMPHKSMWIISFNFLLFCETP